MTDGELALTGERRCFKRPRTEETTPHACRCRRTSTTWETPAAVAE